MVLAAALWAAGRAQWLAADETIAPVNRQPTDDANSTAASKKATKRTPTVALDPQSAWASSASCTATIQAALAQPRSAGLRIASWNLHWFPNGRSGDELSAAGGTDVEWMACAMASLRADVIAVQEVTTGPTGRAALLRLIDRLAEITGGHWREYLDDCSGGRRQHLGLLYDASRVTMAELHDVAELNPHKGACAGGLRPGVSGRLRAGRIELQLTTLHLDSGETPRDYNNRLRSIRQFATSQRAPDSLPSIALGDFNTMGCSSCELPADVEEEVTQLGRLLTPAGYRFVEADAGTVTCSEHYEGIAQLLDRAVTTLPAARVRLEMAGLCAELTCKRPRTTSAALSRLSDHCPIVVEVSAPP